jgi:hypothetical protein
MVSGEELNQRPPAMKFGAGPKSGNPGASAFSGVARGWTTFASARCAAEVRSTLFCSHVV